MYHNERAAELRQGPGRGSPFPIWLSNRTPLSAKAVRACTRSVLWLVPHPGGISPPGVELEERQFNTDPRLHPVGVMNWGGPNSSEDWRACYGAGAANRLPC